MGDFLLNRVSEEPLSRHGSVYHVLEKPRSLPLISLLLLEPPPRLPRKKAEGRVFTLPPPGLSTLEIFKVALGYGNLAMPSLSCCIVDSKQVSFLASPFLACWYFLANLLLSPRYPLLFLGLGCIVTS
jgi:hypothetical protein